MPRTLFHTIRWPATSPDGRAPQSPTRGDPDAVEAGDTHWPTCLRLDRLPDLTGHPFLLKAADDCPWLAEKVMPAGYVVTDERTGGQVGILVRARARDVEFTSRHRDCPSVPRWYISAREEDWFAIAPRGFILDPRPTFRACLLHLVAPLRVPVVREPDEPTVPEVDEPMDPGDDAALAGIRA